ncbi:hypothetical protein ACHAPE_003015 [Trichoderma viride]
MSYVREDEGDMSKDQSAQQSPIMVAEGYSREGLILTNILDSTEQESDTDESDTDESDTDESDTDESDTDESLDIDWG